MNEQFWWHLSRASGIVAWLMLTASVVWGLLLATRLLQTRRRPAWLNDLHRWLGGLAVTFTGVHLAALVLDGYVEFGIADLLIPFASDWKPGAVAWGVVAFWILLAVQLTSLSMRRLPRRVWRWIHLTSYALFWTAAIHGATAGTDASRLWYRVGAAATLTLTVYVVLYRILTVRRVRRAARSPAPAG